MVCKEQAAVKFFYVFALNKPLHRAHDVKQRTTCFEGQTRLFEKVSESFLNAVVDVALS